MQSVVLENSHVILFNTSAPALKDKRLRQALSYAIDRKKLNEALWQGKNYSPNGYQLPAFGSMYNPARPGYTYDRNAHDAWRRSRATTGSRSPCG